ncbi:MAG: pirin family protein [Nocardioidaceae bacterium]
MSEHEILAVRGIARVEDRRRLGPDAQVDDKAMVFAAADPALTDPFLFLAEDWFSSPGFEWHPHRGIETVTTVVDGVLEHGDNLGNTGALEPGDVQWMTAGRGIIHRELAYRNEHAHTLQLWLNLPAARKLTDTRYQDLLATGRPRVTRPVRRWTSSPAPSTASPARR